MFSFYCGEAVLNTIRGARAIRRGGGQDLERSGGMRSRGGVGGNDFDDFKFFRFSIFIERAEAAFRISNAPGFSVLVPDYPYSTVCDILHWSARTRQIL